ncbi:hypothetical protein [Streptomyces sp. NPDC051997]
MRSSLLASGVRRRVFDVLLGLKDIQRVHLGRMGLEEMHPSLAICAR